MAPDRSGGPDRAVVVEVMSHRQLGLAAGAVPYERRVEDTDGAAPPKGQQRARVCRATVGVRHEMQRLVLKQGGADVGPRRATDDGVLARGQRGQDHDGALVRRAASESCLEQHGHQRMHEGTVPQALDRPIGGGSATEAPRHAHSRPINPCGRPSPRHVHHQSRARSSLPASTDLRRDTGRGRRCPSAMSHDDLVVMCIRPSAEVCAPATSTRNRPVRRPSRCRSASHDGGEARRDQIGQHGGRRLDHHPD